MLVGKVRLCRRGGNVDRKQRKEQRKKGYFLQAAMKLVREEGYNNITVKRIADLAGFAPGTLYNYFADLDDLLYCCAYEFWEECREYVLKGVEDCNSFRERVISFARAYCNYFINNPRVFELLFLSDIDEAQEGVPEAPEIATWFSKSLQQGAETGYIQGEKVSFLEDLLGYSIHGLLLFHIKGRSDTDSEDVMRFIEEEIDFVLNRE